MKRAEGKDWLGNMQSTLTNIGARNNAARDREADDFYATEPKAVHELWKRERFSEVWECACGAGHLAEALKEYGALAKASDKHDRGYGERIDFLEYKGAWGGDILTNPPYKFASEFIAKGMSLLQEGRKMALFLPVRYLEGKARRRLFDAYPLRALYVSTGPIKCALGGNFEMMTGSAMSFCWYVWQRGWEGEPALRWFNDGDPTEQEGLL
jgi:hypothetical protein